MLSLNSGMRSGNVKSDVGADLRLSFSSYNRDHSLPFVVKNIVGNGLFVKADQ